MQKNQYASKFLPTYHTMSFRHAESSQDAFRQGLLRAVERRESIAIPGHAGCFEAGIIAGMLLPEETVDQLLEIKDEAPDA